MCGVYDFGFGYVHLISTFPQWRFSLLATIVPNADGGA